MYTCFIKEQTPDLTTSRLTIKQVTDETLELVNHLMCFSNDYTYITRITRTRLRHTKYFIAFVDQKPVCVSGFNMHEWGYDTKTFSILGNVTVPGYEEHNYMKEMRTALLTYLTEFGFTRVSVQIHQDGKTSIKMHEELGFTHVKSSMDHVFMCRELDGTQIA
jgi:RimJ/RimL family protein N-acetyltransferase